MTVTLNELYRQGQSAWLDFISRGMIARGQLKELVDAGIRGVTSNPTIFHQAIMKGDDYDHAIAEILQAESAISTHALYDRLICQDIQMAADLLRPTYESSRGLDGLVSLEPRADLAYDTTATVAEVKRLWQMVDRANVMIKVPGTREGVRAVEQLVGQGININITLMFSMRHYEAVASAYLNGIGKVPDPRKVVSVASFFVSRVDTYVDKELERIGSQDALALRGKAAVANSKLVYRRFKELFHGKDFDPLRKRGARIQRVLWGSTGTKNPIYSDVKYVEELIGPDTINTLPIQTIEAFRDHGRVRPTLDEGVEESQRVLDGLRNLGLDLDAITEQLQKDGVRAFEDSLEQLLKGLDQKRQILVG